MSATWLRARASFLVVGVGAVLLSLAVVHHLVELTTTSLAVGPILAFAFDAGLAACLIVAGYRLGRTELPTAQQWTVAVWCCSGLVLFVVAIGATMGIRLLEGRTLAEPVFTLLVVAGTGAIAGYVAGYYRARAVVDTQRAEQATGALAFVNGIIRHDLRNDMQVIQANADLLTDADEERIRDRAESIAEKTRTATDRIESTGAIMRTVTGEADFEPVDLTAVVGESVDRLRSTYDVTVTTDLPERASVTANTAVESVVDNLLENAVEHNDSDDPRVDVTVEHSDGTVRLVVSDNGPGLPDAVGADLFEAAGSSPGGLQIVQTLVDQFDGTVHVADDDTDGATFVVTVPRAT